MIGSALNLITRELMGLGIDSPALHPPPEPVSSVDVEPPLFSPSIYQQQPPQYFYPVHDSLQLSPFDNMNQPAFHISPELFEAVSSIQPLSVRVGALDDQKSDDTTPPSMPT